MVTRYYIVNLIKNLPEAKGPLTQWQDGELRFEQVMMEVIKNLCLSKQELQRKYHYIPVHIRETHKPPQY